MAAILVLDDVFDAVVLLRRIFEKRGHEVVCFTEEEEAIEYVRSHTVDLAILDMKLKKMEGVEVLAEMKKADPRIRAIMLTGYPTLDSAWASLRLGADEYCIKPIDMEEIEEKVDALLARKEG